jgi:DNA-binding response OmpR family regulator
VELRRKEYLALALLWEKQGALVSKGELAQRVWPEHDGAVTDDDITQVVSGIRRKVEADPAQPRHLLTVRGLGYRLTT